MSSLQLAMLAGVVVQCSDVQNIPGNTEYLSIPLKHACLTILGWQFCGSNVSGI